jgi:hypothetical protein
MHGPDIGPITLLPGIDRAARKGAVPVMLGVANSAWAAPSLHRQPPFSRASLIGALDTLPNVILQGRQDRSGQVPGGRAP